MDRGEESKRRGATAGAALSARAPNRILFRTTRLSLRYTSLQHSLHNYNYSDVSLGKERKGKERKESIAVIETWE